jgi:hypothetical protein
MNLLRLEQLRPVCCSAALLLTIAGCGGGSGGGASTPVATTTNVSTTVVDGALQNAVVCIDKNANGQCDADETQGKTDASGNVTLAVPNDDVGKYPILAVVGTDAIDADNGPVTTPYVLSAPADQVAVVSPLTTLVQQTIASTGASTADAAKAVQDATGITVSLFQDFTKVAAPTDGSVSAATVARMLVVTTQQQATTIASTLGTTAVDGATITQADLDKAIQKKLLELLPALITALSDPAVLAATTPADKEAALLAAATALVADAGLTPAAVATVVAINTQGTTPTADPAPTPAAGINLDALTYTDASNYFVRILGGSATQNTPDASNNIKYVERRTRSIAGNVAKWSAGGDPWRNADLSWNGSAWVACPINFENTASVRDALGNNVYSYCGGRETGKSSRATFDIAGKTLAEVYTQITTAGFTNYTIADAASALGSATFPAESKLFYQTNTPLTEAISYYPGGANSAPGFSNVVSQYSAAVSAGGTASAQASGTACNSTETASNGTNSTTLEGMIAAKTGTPCVYAPGSFTYGGVTYSSGDKNEWWGNSTVSLGKIGTAPVGSGTAPGYFTTNTLLRVAFQGSGTNPVTYYACQERFNNGSTRNCTAIGTGSYTITQLGDARAMTLSNPPLQAASLNYNRVFVERGGLIYLGYQSKPTVTNKARLNAVASTALLTQLGLTPEDPSVPMALTAGSYQGTWDFRQTGSAISPTNGTTVFLNGNGSTSCQDRETGSFSACTVTITDPATGAFTLVDGVTTASGSFDFMAGTVSGTYNDPTATPADGNFEGGRR